MRLETTDYLYQPDTYIGVSIATLTTLAVFAGRGLYNNLTRHISIETANSIAIGSAISCAALLSGTLLLELEIPRSVPLIYATLVCALATAMRYFVRDLGQSMAKENRENVAIYGAGAAGIQLMEALRKNPNYRVRLFIDDNRELDGKNLGGVPISNLDHAKKKFEKLEIETLLLAIPNDSDTLRGRVLNMLSDHPLKVKTIPSISSLISGRFEITELKDIKIEDLLGREPVQHNTELMAKTIAERTVLVTGAGGSIGSELCRQIILWMPRKLILLDVSEFAIYTLLEELKQHPASSRIDLIPLIGSVQDRQFIEKIFDRFSADTIYHAAAYKHVPLMEQNVMQCITNNVFGTLNMAELAIAAKVKHFILVSTDKAVNPTNFMGASKRLAEIICQTLTTQNTKTCFSIVRFGNVLGSSGSVVPLFKKQIEKGGPITLTHLDVTRYFMTIPEAAQLVIQSGSIAKGGDVFVLDMGKPIKIVDLAKRMITLSGLRPVLDVSEKVKEDEIAITVSGLRSGEKLFEELAYHANLMETIHPRINTTAEIPMPFDQLKLLLEGAEAAIRDSDHQKLYQVIAKVTKGVSGVAGSSDVFIRRHNVEPDKIVPLPLSNKR
ncbi:nucleoside-diphosphate sugar epimerase/dehydratase [Alphaproteobacteria bacterium]|nr:nucleoside-diphosphate sugar epimerase/dehydratase [Alphaproteobacteria bacterium]MDC1157081.1 nucleoside-diphosphate sugar epimerase/dehydratase [Alphaproteobacteria bacterium]